jgi:2-polyprenyl-3-methyl-5-hydroxy-6-metoxy-1,4-benzoquinol methylase
VTGPTSHAELFELGCVTAVLATLAQVGALELLVAEPCTPAQLAERLSLDAGATQRALDLLATMGLLVHTPRGYQVDPALVAMADLGPAPVQSLIRLMRLFPQHLRDGATLTDDPRGRAALYQAATPGLGRLFKEEARVLAARLGAAGRILDVGAGVGVWSLAMAKRGRVGVHVTALDLPSVLPGFVQAASSAGVPHGVVAGEYLTATPGADFDRVILANVLRLETPDRARRLLHRAATWRRPGGEVVVVDRLFSPPGAARARAVYALHLALRIRGGTPHSVEQVVEWAHEVGLGEVDRALLNPQAGTGAVVLR